MSKKDLPPDTAAAPQKPRQRRYHQRSRNGCITCKKRHVRCDEARPLCMNCLRNGGECGYPDPFVSFPGSASEAGPRSETPPARRTGRMLIKSDMPSSSDTRQVATWQAPQHSCSLLDMTPKDSLAGLMLSGPLTKLPAQSRWLFHTFAQRSIQDRPGVSGPKESFVVHKALANPGMLHVCLSLSAIQHLWSTGSDSWGSLKIPLQYHKVEAYRYVRQQIENPKEANNDTTITTVASLALLEASLWEIKAGPAAGSIQNILTHLQGLQKIVETYLKPKDSEQTLFQRTIMMGTRVIQEGIVMQPEIAEQVSHEIYQPLVPSVLFMSLWPNPLSGWWNNEVKPAARAWFANDLSPGGKKYTEFTDVPTDSAQFAQFTIASRNAYYTAFLFMCMMLREGALSSFILKLLIDQLLDDAERTEKAFLEGRCNPSIWFWTMMMTLAAVASAPAEDELEAMQIITWQGAIRGKIRLANTILGLNDWESAKAHLKLIAWEEGFDGENEMRQMWKDITWDDSKPLADQDQTVLVLLNNPDYRKQFTTGLSTPEDTIIPGLAALEE
ncbi:hypothetical protein CONLIGDRAFT_191062 [Coniochaeta ligniaria NRRL 30616]|uniref:Zn(2)-C6 fungal-type domain-containing protein n=1 Tax=Coniochaeta ligniaria NRRL 30616 TaxID=1408157 RepID=A0A1J7JWI1_9PEZI|nr:hypothetical protein CONLIGDRAFT_191062 [Coniochaeta ligniaria NRRL 30616]